MPNITYTRFHTRGQMARRGITFAEVLEIIRLNDVIEDYPTDTPCPSRLLYGKLNGRVIHVVVGTCPGIDHVITAYLATTQYFEDDLRTRKKKGTKE